MTASNRLDALTAAARKLGANASACAALAAELFGLPPAPDGQAKAFLEQLADEQLAALVAQLPHAAKRAHPAEASSAEPPARAPRRDLASLKVTVGPRGLAPATLAEVLDCAEFLYRAGLAGEGTREEVAVRILHGAEIGLTPLQSVATVMMQNNRPTIWGDALPALLHQSGLLTRKEVVDIGTPGQPDAGVEVRLWRKGHDAPFVGRWTRADAERAGLVGRKDRHGKAFDSTHERYPESMGYRRAIQRAATRGFADVLRGLAVQEDEVKAADEPERANAAPTSAYSAEVMTCMVETEVAKLGAQAETIATPEGVKTALQDAADRDQAAHHDETQAHDAAWAALRDAAKAAGMDGPALRRWMVRELGLVDVAPDAKPSALAADLRSDVLAALAANLSPKTVKRDEPPIAKDAPDEVRRAALYEELKVECRRIGWNAERAARWAKARVFARPAVNDATPQQLWGVVTLEELASLVGDLQTLTAMEEAVEAQELAAAT